MKWNEAPTAEDWAALRETPQQAQDRARIALEIMVGERGQNPDNAEALEREIARTSQLARVPIPLPGTARASAAGRPPNEPPAQTTVSWDQAPEVQEESWMNAPEVKDASWASTLAAIPDTAMGALKRATGGFMQWMAEGEKSSDVLMAAQTGKTVKELQLERRDSPLYRKGTELAEAGKEQAKVAQPENLDFWKTAVLNGVTSTALMAPGLVASIATRNPAPALGAAAALAKGESFAEGSEENLDPEAKARYSNINAAAEAVFELLPTKFLTDNFGKETLKLITGFLYRDLGGELATTTVQSANAKLHTRPDMTWEEYGKDLLDTAGATIVSSALTGGGVGMAGRMMRRNQETKEAPAPDAQAPGMPPANGSVNTPLTGPNMDAVTIPLDSAQMQTLLTEAESIDASTVDDNQLEEARRLVESEKNQQQKPPLQQAQLAWPQIATAPTSPLEQTDIGELGATQKQADNAIDYINPNTADRYDRVISFGPAEFVGLTPRQVMPKPGTYVLGEASADRPAEYLAPYQETIEQWRREYLPDSTIVVSNEQMFTNSALGWHYTTGPGQHMIVPAVLRKKVGTKLSEFNVNTQASAFYNATHEFGHALINDRFFEAVQPEVASMIRKESETGIIQTMGLLPPAQQAVVKEYNELKQRILKDDLTAEAFVERWLSPGKIGRKNFLKELKVAPSAPARQLVDAIVDRAVVNSNIKGEISSKALRKRLTQDYLSLDEYLAEQMSRHAYQRKWDQKSPLGQYFSKALESLRNFFIDRKKDGTIAPGVAFQEWLDGLSATNRLAAEKEAVVDAKKKAGKRKAAASVAKPKVKGKTKAAPAPAKVERVEHNVRADSDAERTRKANGMMVQLIRGKVLEQQDAQYQELKQLVKLKAWDEFIDLYQGIAGKTVKFELDVKPEQDVRHAGEHKDAFKEWQQEKFDSRFFKAWFGDWQRDAGGSSKARIGAVTRTENGFEIDLASAGQPLVLFTSLDRLQAGQNIFHASTLRGNLFYEAENTDSDPSLSATQVPVVLNIRNPYMVQAGLQVAPPREELIEQGYDGIIYENDLEGHVSWIVFNPGQIKVVPTRVPYKGKVFMELDHDQATPEGHGAARLDRGLKNFVRNPRRLRRALRWVTSKVLNLQQRAHLNPDLEELQFMNTENTNYNRYGASRQAEPNAILDRWSNLSKGNWEKVNKFLLDEYEGRQHWFGLKKTKKMREGQEVNWSEFEVTNDTLKKFEEYGIDVNTPAGQEVSQLILRVKNSTLDMLNEDEKILFNLYAHRFGNKPNVYKAQLTILKKHMETLRQVPILHQGRFGNNVLIVEKERENGRGWEVVWREHFEDPEEWSRAVLKAEKKVQPGERVRKMTLNDSDFTLMSMPKDFVDTMASELDLADEQVERLREILMPAKQERILSRSDQARLGIKGYSRDTMRSFADYAWHHSNLQSKMLYRKSFNLAIDRMRERVRQLETQPGLESINEIDRLRPILREMELTKEYVMAPPNELQTARALVSLAYLALNVKTALVNFYGLVTTVSSFHQRFGSVDGAKRFSKATLQAVMTMRLTSLNERRAGKYLPPELEKGVDRALQEGVLSQSYAYHLAGMATAGNLSRMYGGGAVRKYSRKAVDLAMFPFRLVELMTRRIAFIAELQAQLDNKNQSEENAYTEAVNRVNLTQNDYSLGNRVPFMRGGAFNLGPLMPLATVFMSFAQHMAFHSYGGFEMGERRKAAFHGRKVPHWYDSYTGRIWLITLFLAGYEGLPGAENIIDLIEAFWSRMFKGAKPIRQELREFVQSIEEDPNRWAHGLAHNVAGVDISKSVGFGRLLPGTDVLAKSSSSDLEKTAGSIMFDLAGPTGGLIRWGLSMMGDSEKAMRQAPGAIGNLYNAYYWSQYGVRGPNDGLILRDPETGIRRDLTGDEIFVKALGFNPTIVSQSRKEFYEKYDMRVRWQTRQQKLREQFWEAHWQGDKEAWNDMKDALAEYNAQIPSDPEFRSLRMNMGDIMRSINERRRRQRLETQGRAQQRKFEGPSRSVEESFRRPGDNE